MATILLPSMIYCACFCALSVRSYVDEQSFQSILKERSLVDEMIATLKLFETVRSNVLPQSKIEVNGSIVDPESLSRNILLLSERHSESLKFEEDKSKFANLIGKENATLQNVILAGGNLTHEQIVSSQNAITNLRNLIAEENSIGHTRLLKMLREMSTYDNLTVLILTLLSMTTFIVALTYFSKAIASRILLSLQNAKRIPARIALNPAFKGNDELVYLDQILHNSADELKELVEYRQTLLRSVASEFQKTLVHTKASLLKLREVEGNNQNQSVKNHLKKLDFNNARMDRLVQDLSILDSLETGHLDLEKEELNVRNLFDAVAQSVQPITELKQISIELITDSAHFVLADHTRVMQILTNLISNAIKFSPSAGKITMTSEVVSQGKLRLLVSDQGPGISAEDCSRVFEKFYQTEAGRKQDGFGLGLSICKLISKSHGGEIGVTSKLGEGATFWFTLEQSFNRLDHRS